MKNFPVGFLRRVIPVVAILALSGCSDLDVFGLFEDDTTVAQTAADAGVRSRADTEQAKAEDGDTPSLRNVPLRPAPGSSAERNRVVEGLISDRDNARYTDEGSRAAPARRWSRKRLLTRMSRSLFRYQPLNRSQLPHRRRRLPLSPYPQHRHPRHLSLRLHRPELLHRRP